MSMNHRHTDKDSRPDFGGFNICEGLTRLKLR